MNMTIMITLTLIVSVLLMLLNNWLAIMKPNNEKLSPYECGFDPLESAWLPFSIRFFLVAILFLLFDLEIALLLPIPWATQLSSPILSMTWTLIILALLTLGLMYEWVQGGLEWAE
uniref:NADH-ubiquinone oxidoreductase chain 3 n=3 Tax=Chelodina TaxID=44490 RepID=A0A455I4Y8_9SAUR|nr:NADH dehydrogenase subunit 3 [Chelodina longicollis]YP_009473071.1 NADH dehydrogenase subunit 3 [Chelodina expansa]YP_009571071.1 NADH dehydrogenase subunit 3 [Chelodina canni]AIH00088.1 NADH dehydrogenase subunit 3 [Chelodina longicollis]AUW54977.1 NADH dehydrogenase subunit 3 [Chelodina expansa]AUY55002.1 NADH dehydrogenase subunit 3 [Chelodina canni]